MSMVNYIDQADKAGLAFGERMVDKKKSVLVYNTISSTCLAFWLGHQSWGS